MKYRVIFAPEAREDYESLHPWVRAAVRDGINRHQVHQPTQVSRGRIKRLRGVSRPQFRLRIEGVRVFCDVTGDEVAVLAIVDKARASRWLRDKGVME